MKNPLCPSPSAKPNKARVRQGNKTDKYLTGKRGYKRDKKASYILKRLLRSIYLGENGVNTNETFERLEKKKPE